MTDGRRVVIVGGSIAGWTLAASLRDGGFEGAITIVEREPACYDRPPLSKTVLTAGAGLADISFADDAKLAALGIDVRVGRTAIALDGATRTVSLDDGSSIRGDVVVLATGARARGGAFPGAELPGVLTLRTWSDAAALRALAGRPVAIVGAGLIGAEAAAALRGAGSPVVLIDPNEVPATRVFGPTLAQHLHAMHTANGVDVRIDTVAAVTRAGDALCVRLTRGDTIEVAGVLVATGIDIDTTLAQHAGLEIDEGIVVEKGGRTRVDGILAVGDATRRRGADGLAHPSGHWETAELDARAVAATILGAMPDARGAEWFWSDRYGHHIEVVGDVTTRGTEIVRPGAHPTVFRVDGDVLVGAASVDDPMTVRAARRLIGRAVPVRADQLADADVPVRSLVPRPARVLSPS